VSCSNHNAVCTPARGSAEFPATLGFVEWKNNTGQIRHLFTVCLLLTVNCSVTFFTPSLSCEVGFEDLTSVTSLSSYIHKALSNSRL